jgi:hypothetical protein
MTELQLLQGILENQRDLLKEAQVMRRWIERLAFFGLEVGLVLVLILWRVW